MTKAEYEWMREYIEMLEVDSEHVGEGEVKRVLTNIIYDLSDFVQAVYDD